MNTPQIFHLEGDIWLVPCMASFSRNKFHPLAVPADVKIKKAHHRSEKNWNAVEDEILKKIIESKGTKVWNTVAKELNTLYYAGKEIRRGRHCRERWYNHLDPKLIKGDWTDKEDIFILEQQRIHGNKWSDIAKKLPGRNENSVKNRWKTMIQKATKDHPRGNGIIDLLIAQKTGIDKEENYDENDAETKNEAPEETEIWYSTI
ncbi:unnamed protein product [Blepharisma stoltei]|uniref:Myb-like DNA-binding domain containing protein n=1 Tax=Blepharisma stoltei TaxID=1481888 RepID=A0AAU9J8Y1_9CILI|nr:unnamed protein product [Blepharisma stoltei]